MCMCLCMGLCLHVVCVLKCPKRPKEGVRSPKTRVLDTYGSCECWEPNLSIL